MNYLAIGHSVPHATASVSYLVTNLYDTLAVINIRLRRNGCYRQTNYVKVILHYSYRTCHYD